MTGAEIAGAAGMVANIAQNQFNSNKQHRRQKEYMNIQFNNQQALNRQASELAFAQWNRTNYSAQVKHLKDAGLNPALLYGMGGAGGSTAQTGSGGSAQGGQAQQAVSMDIAGQVSAVQKLQAEIDLLKSQKDNVDANTNERNENVNLIQSQVKEIVAGIGKIFSETNLNNLKGLTEIAGVKKIQSETDLNKAKENLTNSMKKLEDSKLTMQEFENAIKEIEKERAEKGVVKGDTIGNILHMMDLDPSKQSDRDLFQILVYSKFGIDALTDIIGAIPNAMWGGMGKLLKNLTKRKGKGFEQFEFIPENFPRLDSGRDLPPYRG